MASAAVLKALFDSDSDEPQQPAAAGGASAPEDERPAAVRLLRVPERAGKPTLGRAEPVLSLKVAGKGTAHVSPCF